MKDRGDSVTGCLSPPPRQSLLNHFGIFIEEIEYKYVEKCTDGKKLEQILLVLRSGEEGIYPHLEDFVSKQLEKVDPSNPSLRVEIPILRPEDLQITQRRELEMDLIDWIELSGSNVVDEIVPTKSNEIFNIIGESPMSHVTVPVRGSTVISSKDIVKNVTSGGNGEGNFLKPNNPNRIKSLEYEKWNKFDVDTELMKLEIEDMKTVEPHQVELLKASNKFKLRPQVGEFQEKKSTNPVVVINDSVTSKDSPCPCSSKSIVENSYSKSLTGVKSTKLSVVSPPGSNSITSCSFIEEILPEEIKQVQNSESKRRVKIIIDDINIGGL